MSSQLHRTRGAVRARADSDRPATTFRWKYWRIAALSVCLVLTVLLTSWVRRSASLVGRGTGRLSNKGEESSFVAPLKSTFSSTATAAEIMEELRRVADQLAESFPNDATALDVLAKVEFALGHRTEAMGIWHTCAQLRPSDAAPYFSAMGIIAANCGAPDEAAELFRKAIELGSRDPQTPVMLADNLMKAGQFDDAVAVLETHLQKGLFSNAALTTLGQAYQELDQCEKAKTTFLAAIQADPKSKTAYYGLARAYAKLGDDARAKTYMEHFAKLDTQASAQHMAEIKTFSDDASTRQMGLRALIDAARCYRSHEQFTNAEQLLQNAAALAPDDVESRLELVTLYEQLGRDQAALKICKQLQIIDPNNGDYWMNEGVLNARLGKLVEGLSALRRALQLDPHNQRYRETLDLIRREVNGE